MSKKEPSNFIEPKHIKRIILFALICYISIYFCFCGKGFIPPGNELNKSDWLSFVGDFLSFIGTVAVSWAALWQTKHYYELDEQRREEERLRAVQPVFSVTIKQCSEFVIDSDYHQTASGDLNFISITNVNTYPIANVKVFDNYQIALLQSNDPLIIKCAYDNCRNIEFVNDVQILSIFYDRNHLNMPKAFRIIYDDIDGRTMDQVFELQNCQSKYYYSLKKDV